jgi:hypothetical protein
MPPSDPISLLMGGNVGTAITLDEPALLKGLGTALLGRFATTQSDFQQSAVDFEPDYSTHTAAGFIPTTAADVLPSAKSAPNNVSLKLHLVSGKEVDISVTFGGADKAIRQSLGIDVHTSGKLTDAERTALAQLSKGFEAALQGISQGEAKIDVSGLVNFDPSVLSAVDLTVRAPPPPPTLSESPGSNPLQSLDFHADAAKRSLAVKSLAGNVSVKVDFSQLAFLGTAAQQQTAVQRYLDQFDAASKRGHGDTLSLTEFDTVSLTEFKDAFAQLNSSYPAGGKVQPGALSSSVLSDQDHSVLSGLADFQASMSGGFQNGSAAHWTTEAGHIDYQVSQHTQTSGVAKSSGLSVVQTQAATLVASFVRSRDGAMLDTEKGNYDLYRINDSTSTTTSFAYADSKLQSASIINQVNQSEQYEKFVNHKVVEQTSTPRNTLTMQDISALLRPTA